MADLQQLQLDVKVNTETGQLEVLGAKLQEVGEKAKKTGESFLGLSAGARELLGSLGMMATVGGVVAFFRESVVEAEKDNEAIRRLSFALEANGVSWKENESQILSWSKAVQAQTRFSDTEALSALEKMSRATKDVGQAEAGAKLAMDLSVASGKNLSETTEFVTQLMSGHQRAVMMAGREYKAFVGDATTAQEVLDRLSAKVRGASDHEESFTKKSAEAKHALEDLEKTIGRTILPGLGMLANGFRTVLIWVEKLMTGVAGVMYEMVMLVQEKAKVTTLILTGHFKDAAKELGGTWGQIKQTFSDTMDEIGDIDKREKAAELFRLDEVNHIKAQKNTQQEAEDKRKLVEHEAELEKAIQKDIKAHQERARQIVEMEDQLSKRLAGIDDNTYRKKLNVMRAEMNAERDKVRFMLITEEQKAALILKIDEVEQKSKVELEKWEMKRKFSEATEIVDLSLQTLAIINDMGDKRSKAEATRAKAILAMEKAIAIAKIWAENAAHPWLAGAQTALVVAQFAQQSRSIDQARDAAAQGNEQIKVSTELNTGQTLDQIFNGTGAGSAGGTGAGASAAPVGGFSPGGSGGGGGTNINVGGVSIYFSAGSVDISNVDLIANKLADAVLRGTVPAVQLALRIGNAIDKRGALAV